MRNIITYMDKRQYNSWWCIGVGLAGMGFAVLPDGKGITSIILGFLVSMIGGYRGK